VSAHRARRGLGLRLLAGGVLAAGVARTVLAPESPLPADTATVAVFALTCWRARMGLAAALLVAPWGLLLADAPMRLAELLAWSFLSAWLLALGRPLGAEGGTMRAMPMARAVLVPALLYAGCAFASWLGLTLRAASGIEPGALPSIILRLLAFDHVLFPFPEPETWTWLQTAAGVALLLAAAAVARADSRAPRTVAFATIGTGTALAVATLVDGWRQWTAHGTEFLLRYVRGERFALHMPDLNAAGSVYVLAILVAATLAIAEPRRRWIHAVAAVLMIPALWLTGSRSAALGALLVGMALIPVVRSRETRTLARPASVGLLLVVLAVGGVAVGTARQPAEPGSAAQSLRLRSQFFVTSARMLASAPVFGVGIGRYHERSSEFMPEELRAVYRHENAHNYFAQQFAELGIVGGLVFVWFIAAALATAWRGVVSPGASPIHLALFAAAAGYLLTCVTGHPLLVPEAAMPFWILFGAAAGASVSTPPSRSHVRTALGLAVALGLGVGIARDARAYARPSAQPPERGFYGLESTADGTEFVWMTRHGVWHIGSQPGFLTIPVRAPGQSPAGRPFELRVDVAGWSEGQYEVPAERWTEIRIPVRERSSLPFRRVDLWANQVWVAPDPESRPGAYEPKSVMIGEVRWESAGSR
jgi:O-antigen ligase